MKKIVCYVDNNSVYLDENSNYFVGCIVEQDAVEELKENNTSLQTVIQLKEAGFTVDEIIKLQKAGL